MTADTLADGALSTLLILLEVLTESLLALCFVPLKRPKQYGGAIVLASVLLYLEQHFISWNGAAGTDFHTVFLMLAYALVTFYLFQCRALQAFAVALLAGLYMSVVDCLFMSVLFLVWTAEEQAAQPFVAYGISFLAKLTEAGALLAFYRRRARRTPRQPDMTGWKLICLFSIPAYLLAMSLSRAVWFSPDALWISLIIPMLLSFVCVGALFLLDYSDRRRQTDRENSVLRGTLQLETARVAAVEGRYDQQRRQTHDFKNQLAVLRDMAGRHAPQEEFAAYLDAVIDAEPPGTLAVSTNRTVVDVILSEKVPAAREKGIDFQLRLDDLAGFPMPDDALVVVLTNLIDNAVEACEKIPDPDGRHILLKMRMKEKTALLGAENTTAAPVDVRDNTVRTTKADQMAHGYGLKIVAAMVERCGGMWFIEYREADKRFCFSASLPREPESQSC